MKEKESIWRLDVSDEYLTFTKEDKPDDFDIIAIEQPYNDLNGTYCGNRGFDDVQFKLHRNLKLLEIDYKNPEYMDDYNTYGRQFSLRKWRIAHGFAYAWEPSYYYEYKKQIFATHINFR